MHILRSSARGLRAGFTLIEMLAVILIITILMTFLIPKAVEAIDQAKVTGCRKNMQEIYAGFQLYQTKFENKMPNKSGVRFFAELIALKVWEDTKESSKRLNCPNAQHPPGTEGTPQEEWYTDLERLDGTWSSYAGRDCKQFPLKSMSGKEPLVADDNDGGGNHKTATVVLYGDGTAQTFELGPLVVDGTIQKDEQLIVGPESQVEDLKKFSLD
ncbi:MAG TPA: prepilin-type N-terminal cleavage/methylation domain-containing protein [Planctomycetota bacterium]|nr:prepilin-type N-terminal cleavage/methylation domain-containing protein [Planctomycetota bacterium]